MCKYLSKPKAAFRESSPRCGKRYSNLVHSVARTYNSPCPPSPQFALLPNDLGGQPSCGVWRVRRQADRWNTARCPAAWLWIPVQASFLANVINEHLALFDRAKSLKTSL